MDTQTLVQLYKKYDYTIKFRFATHSIGWKHADYNWMSVSEVNNLLPLWLRRHWSAIEEISYLQLIKTNYRIIYDRQKLSRTPNTINWLSSRACLVEITRGMFNKLKDTLDWIPTRCTQLSLFTHDYKPLSVVIHVNVTFPRAVFPCTLTRLSTHTVACRHMKWFSSAVSSKSFVSHKKTLLWNVLLETCKEKRERLEITVTVAIFEQSSIKIKHLICFRNFDGSQNFVAIILRLRAIVGTFFMNKKVTANCVCELSQVPTF